LKIFAAIIVLRRLGVLLLGMGWAAIAQCALPTVLVIESYHPEYAWDQQYSRALREQLAGVAELEFFAMDTKRLPTSEFARRADAAWVRYQALQPALVILADDNALRLLGRRFAATAVPVVYLGINQNPRLYFDQPPANISGVLERPFMRRSIAYLNLVMQRRLAKVLVLFDDSPTAQTVLQETFGGTTTQMIGSTVTQIRLIGSEAQWQQAIDAAPAQGFDLIVVGLYHTLRDADGAHVPEQRVLAWSAAHSRLPLFCFWAFSVGPGMTAGGLVLDGYEQGSAAATMARDILQGGKVPRLPLSGSGGVLTFSRSQLQHWGIVLPDRIAEQAQLLP